MHKTTTVTGILHINTKYRMTVCVRRRKGRLSFLCVCIFQVVYNNSSMELICVCEYEDDVGWCGGAWLCE